MMRTAPILMLALAIAACGDAGPLRPKDGHDLPPRPAMASATPDADALLIPPPYAEPERVDELVKRSTPREPDPFDLPPAEGGPAPTANDSEVIEESEPR